MKMIKHRQGARKGQENDRVAQPVEQLTFNQ